MPSRTSTTGGDGPNAGLDTPLGSTFIRLAAKQGGSFITLSVAVVGGAGSSGLLIAAAGQASHDDLAPLFPDDKATRGFLGASAQPAASPRRTHRAQGRTPSQETWERWHCEQARDAVRRFAAWGVARAGVLEVGGTEDDDGSKPSSIFVRTAGGVWAAAGSPAISKMTEADLAVAAVADIPPAKDANGAPVPDVPANGSAAAGPIEVQEVKGKEPAFAAAVEGRIGFGPETIVPAATDAVAAAARPPTGRRNSEGKPLKKKKNIKPVVQEGSLSIVERVFFKSAPGRPQVIMGIILRLRLPPGVPSLKLERVVDLLRIAQSKHYRLSSYIDPTTMVAHPMAKTAKDLPCNYRFVERKTRDTWQDVYDEEINTNFDVNDATRPLWRSVAIVPKEWMPSDSTSLGQSQLNLAIQPKAPSVFVTAPEGETQQADMSSSAAGADSAQSMPIVPGGIPSSTKPVLANVYGTRDPDILEGQPYFEIMFSFHHCLGDGLSMFAYARTFLERADKENLLAEDLHLENIEVVTEPPPLIDNLLDPWFVEVVPVMGSMAVNRFAKKGRRFKGHKKEGEEERATRPTAVTKAGSVRSPSPAASEESHTPSTASAIQPGNSSLAPSTVAGTAPPSVSIPMTPAARTKVRFLWFDNDFISALRKKSKSEGTTIAAVMVVASLAAVRTSFATLPKYAKKPLPSKQGWVVTNSVRHMLPQSRLLQGGDREVDEGLKMFGGYAGSVTNSSLLLEDHSDVWERCRVVRKSISKCFRDSIQRMKLMNYCYRHPSLWRMVERNTDLAKLSRTYSVEVANLGAWEYPVAPPDAPADDTRCRLDHFGGVVNSSFDGVRGLFTVGLITLGGRMSAAVGYDMNSVHESEADIFVKALCEGLAKLKDSEGKVTVGQIRQ
ncbi:hypothetical protein HK101_002275 [Irineochytrium annulatum]|nr:hypothetical protein HK101_002275 [Irineochytrium annulatum]